MKTKEELNKLKEEITSINQKLNELTPDELEEVAGGMIMGNYTAGRDMLGLARKNQINPNSVVVNTNQAKK